MDKIRVAVQALSVVTVAVAIAVAYIFGVMRGVQSQQPRIKELVEELTGLHVDFFPYVHPLWHPLSLIAFTLAACWIVVTVVALRNRKERT